MKTILLLRNSIRIQPKRASLRRILAIVLIGPAALLLSHAQTGSPNGDSSSPEVQKKHQDEIKRQFDRELRPLSKALDEAKVFAEKWGQVTISEITFVSDSKIFDIQYEKPVSNYVDEAKATVSGTATRLLQQILQNQLAAEITPVLSPRLPANTAPIGAESAKQGTAAVTGQQSRQTVTITSNTSPVYGEHGTNATGTRTEISTITNVEAYVQHGQAQLAPPALSNLSSQLTNQATLWDFLNSNRIAVVGSSTNALPATALPNRVAEKVGMNDRIAAVLMQRLALPKNLPLGQSALFGVMQVSCIPGWRNQFDYSAQIDVAVDYASPSRDGQITPLRLLTGTVTNYGPRVHAVLPLIDPQTLHLESADDTQSEVILSLAALAYLGGNYGAAKDVFKFAQRLQTREETRTVLPTVTTFAGLGRFGMTFRPSFVARRDPARRTSRADNRLIETTFAALVVLIVPDEPRPDNGRLLLTPTLTWIPDEKEKLYKRILVERYSVTEQRQKAMLLDDAVARLKGLWSEKRDIPEGFENTVMSLLSEATNRKSQIVPAPVISKLPRCRKRASDAPTVRRVVPNPFFASVPSTKGASETSVAADAVTATNVAILEGSNFLFDDGGSALYSISLAGRECGFETTSGETALIRMPNTLYPGEWPLVVQHAGGATSLTVTVGTLDHHLAIESTQHLIFGTAPEILDTASHSPFVLLFNRPVVFGPGQIPLTLHDPPSGGYALPRPQNARLPPTAPPDSFVSSPLAVNASAGHAPGFQNASLLSAIWINGTLITTSNSSFPTTAIPIKPPDGTLKPGSNTVIAAFDGRHEMRSVYAEDQPGFSIDRIMPTTVSTTNAQIYLTGSFGPTNRPVLAFLGQKEINVTRLTDKLVAVQLPGSVPPGPQDIHIVALDQVTNISILVERETSQ